MKRRLIFLVFVFWISACMPSASTPTPTAGYINLHDLKPLPTPQESEVRPLRIAIAAVISPRGTAESYKPILDYLSAELDRPVERVQRRTYAEINDLLRSGDVDLAFVCTSSYITGKRDFGLQLVAVPEVAGESTYQAKVIVPKDSDAYHLADLRSRTFAFTDPTSFTGRVYPTYMLQELGEDPNAFFARSFFTFSHDEAIKAVAEGMADGASVDSLVLAFAIKREPELAEQIRVIHTSPPFGMPPVVANPDIRPQLKAELTEILLNMHLEEDGLQALQALDYDRFVLAEDEAYLSAEMIEQSVPYEGIEP